MFIITNYLILKQQNFNAFTFLLYTNLYHLNILNFILMSYIREKIKDLFRRTDKKDVKIVFQKFLGREPETMELINEIVNSKTGLVEFCLNVANSSEFINKKNKLDKQIIGKELRKLSDNNKIKPLIQNSLNLNEDYKDIIIKILNYINEFENNKNEVKKKIIKQKINFESHNFVEYFKNKFYLKLGKRKDDYLYLINLMIKQKVKNIIETGSIRLEENFEGDGCSTQIFSDYSNFFGGEFTSIDIDPNCEKIIKKLRLSAEFINEDSVKALYKHNQKIDLAFLDSFDYSEKIDHESSLHHIFELLALTNNLKKGSIIAIDDNFSGANKGKGQYIKKYFEKIGIFPVLDNYILIYLL